MAELVGYCLCCQQVKAEHQRMDDFLQGLPKLEWKLERITMDFVSRLPLIYHGSKNIWIIAD